MNDPQPHLVTLPAGSHLGPAGLEVMADDDHELLPPEGWVPPAGWVPSGTPTPKPPKAKGSKNTTDDDTEVA